MFGLVSVGYLVWYAFGLFQNGSGLWRRVVCNEKINFSKENSDNVTSNLQ